MSMFLLDKDGTSVREVTEVELRFEWDEKTKYKIHEIHKSTLAKAYYHGSTENSERIAERNIRDYLYDKKPLARILVNDKWYFGNYDKETGEKIFEQIILAIKNGCEFLDMRELENEI